MNFQNILLENEGQITTITINRPQSLNALNGATISELSEALSQLDQDSNCRVIIIREEKLASVEPKANQQVIDTPPLNPPSHIHKPIVAKKDQISFDF